MNEEEILKLVEDAKQMSANIRDRMERIEGLLGTPKKEKTFLKEDATHKLSYKEKEDQFVAEQVKRWNERGNWDYLKVTEKQLKWIENIKKKRNELNDIVFKVS